MTEEKSDSRPIAPSEPGDGRPAPPPGRGAAEGAENDRDKAENAPRKRPDPTRYGDWEKNGRCIDF